MTPDELDAIEARVAAAAAGPWSGVKDGTYRVFTPGGQIVAYSMNAANREFVQHAREDVPALLAEVRRLQAVVERVTALAEDWRYKGEHGWDDGSHAYGPDFEGELLDNASRDLFRVLDAAAPGTTTPAGEVSA